MLQKRRMIRAQQSDSYPVIYFSGYCDRGVGAETGIQFWVGSVGQEISGNLMLVVFNTFYKGSSQKFGVLIIGVNTAIEVVPDEAEIAIPGSFQEVFPVACSHS